MTTLIHRIPMAGTCSRQAPTWARPPGLSSRSFYPKCSHSISHLRKQGLERAQLPPLCINMRECRALAAVNEPTSAAAGAAIDGGATEASQPLVYQGVIFDMDGTLSVSCIDYVRMRTSLDIPVGDLFTVMESWTDGQRIRRSMDTILDIEAEAAALSSGMPGLAELLDYLRFNPHVRVGLVTRNTTQSVDAFFSAVGEELRGAFDILLTREHQYVKPDKRCLLHFAEAWGMPPYSLLMVGDSTEDVECGNAAGTATCLIAGGGNETGGEAAGPPPGAVPTFVVDSLHELLERLQRRDTGLGDAEELTSILDAATPGAPPPGLDFLDWLFEEGAVEAAACSFPRIDGSRFGVPPDEHPGSKVLHLQCGDGALTKLLFSAGLLVVGAAAEPQAATKRGLFAAQVDRIDREGALTAALAAIGINVFDAAVLHTEGVEEALWQPAALAEIAKALKPGGKLCVEVEIAKGGVESVLEKVEAAGFSVVTRAECVLRQLSGTLRLRLIAAKLEE